MSDTRRRAHEMLVLMERAGRRPAAWRCSPDLGGTMFEVSIVESVESDESLSASMFSIYELRATWGSYPARTRLVGPPDRYLGLPVSVDERLPPNSLILD